MSGTTGGVIGGDGVPIVPPKEPPEQIHLRLSPTLLREMRAISERTGRHLNEVAELLLRWAVEREKAELDAAGVDLATIRRKKREA